MRKQLHHTDFDLKGLQLTLTQKLKAANVVQVMIGAGWITFDERDFLFVPDLDKTARKALAKKAEQLVMEVAS